MVAEAKMEKTTTATRTRTRRSAKKPHFFKILLRDFAHRLRLPPRFVEDHLRGSSEKAVVHDAGGGAWDVALEKTAHGAFLSGGWTRFVEDHALQEHDLVVFRYDGDMHFTVILSFDRTACEKETTSAEVKHSGGDISKRHKIGKETMKDGAPFPFCSTFPYFVSKMRCHEIVKPRVLRFPINFSWAHTPTTRTCMNLRNPNGKVWTVNYIPSERQRIFGGGWSAFIRDNNLQEGDYCAFEMVAPAEFTITVIRADEVLKHAGDSHRP